MLNMDFSPREEAERGRATISVRYDLGASHALRVDEETFIYVKSGHLPMPDLAY